MLRARLVCEKERIRRLPTQYPWNRAQALEKLQELIPGMTDEDLEKWEMAGKVDFIYIGGEKRYFVRFHKTLAKYPELMRKAGREVSSSSPWLDPMIKTIKEMQDEADHMHHCVMSNEYYKKEDSLIMSAKEQGERLETIEVNLKTMKVVQSYGKYNSLTERHAEILRLVNSNLNKIAELI